MRQKRGFLLAEETLKIIIAVICIGFLAYLLFSVYQNSSNNKNLDFAKSTLSSVADAVNSNQTSVDVYNPDGWSLISWPYDGNEPLSCSNLGWKSCLCICKKPLLGTSSDYLKNCEDSSAGVCVENSFSVTFNGNVRPIEINNPPMTLKIDQKKKEISADGS